VPSLALKDVSTPYSLKEINLRVNHGEFMVILGPSGAGKSTLLNVVAGLTLYTGRVYIGEERVDNLKPAQRNIGYVFQDLCLFPHLTVYENVAFGLKAVGAPKVEASKKVRETLELLDIDRFQHRYPHSLSGGEKQRVALARALVLQPRIMLMDEPLSSLDFNIAKYLRIEFKDLQRKLNLTTLYVTHNLNEAKELADRIAVITEGHLGQVGTAADIFLKPDKKIQHFIPAPNLLPCDQVKLLNSGLLQVRSKGLELVVLSEKPTVNKIAILPQDIHISLLMPPGPEINRFVGQVASMKKVGSFMQCEVKTEGGVLRVEAPTDHKLRQKLVPGQKVWLKVDIKKAQTI
jgi:ABC-type sugar transport system ATPase subunit